MAYEYDRFERDDRGGSFLMGLLAGTILGAGLGMLFAPKSGSELRSQIGDQAGRLRDAANETYSQASGKVGQMVDRGREAYVRARSSVLPGSSYGSTRRVRSRYGGRSSCAKRGRIRRASGSSDARVPPHIMTL
jgi:hypothetical protein